MDQQQNAPNAALKAEAELAAKGAADERGIFDPQHPCRGVTEWGEHGRKDATFRLCTPDGTPRKKIALVGFASSTKDMAPYNDPTWAIVGMNQLNRHIPRADAWIEIHKVWNTALVPGTDHAKWLAECGLPVLMTDEQAGIPTSVRYPVERLIEKFSLDYFTSTVAYMLAWAIDYIDREVESRLLEVESPAHALEYGLPIGRTFGRIKALYAEYCIGIFGIDLVVGEEYTEQRPCAEFWLGQALARDISVLIPPQSALLKQRYRYGYFMEPQDLIRPSDLKKRHALLTSEHQKASERAVALSGAVRALREVRDGVNVEQREKDLVVEFEKADTQCTQLSGALHELETIMQLRELRERGAEVRI